MTTELHKDRPDRRNDRYIPNNKMFECPWCVFLNSPPKTFAVIHFASVLTTIFTDVAIDRVHNSCLPFHRNTYTDFFPKKLEPHELNDSQKLKTVTVTRNNSQKWKTVAAEVKQVTDILKR